MIIRQQQRRGTTSQWDTANPVLAAGEFGVEFSTPKDKLKIGDGVTHWVDLDYVGLEGPPGPAGGSDASFAAWVADDNSATADAIKDRIFAALPVYPVAEFGAVGGGSNDTAAIQAAIDAAHDAGGGTVTTTRGELHGWSGDLHIRSGVCLEGFATRQQLGAGASPSVSGLVALNSAAQIRVGDWTSEPTPAGISNLYVDGNFTGGATATKAGLVRIAGVNLMVNNLYVTRSAGDGQVFDGVQNSTVVGGLSTMNVGSAIVMDNGAGAISFLGGYYGTSKGGLLTMRDTTGEGNLYPFGPTQNTWTGTIFEAYAGQASPINEPFANTIRISGTQNYFDNCNFTGGATTTSLSTVLIDNSALPIIPTTVTFNNCTFWVKQGADAVRMAANVWAVFTGLQSVQDDGTHHALSFICADGATPHVSINGEINMAGDVNGVSHFRAINGGSLAGFFSWKEGGQQYRLRFGQVLSVRREGDTSHRLYIDRDGTLGWFNGIPGSSVAYIQRGAGGTGNGLDYYTATGGEHRFLNGPIRTDSIYFGTSTTPFDPTTSGSGGGSGQPGPPGVVGNTIVDTLNGGTFNLNPAYGTEYTLTITADTTLSASGLVPGSAMTVEVLQDGVGSHTLTIPTAWIGQADFTPNVIANNYDILVVWRSPLGMHVKRVHTGALPSSSWTPNALADPQVWYIGDSLPIEDGQAVATWDNQWTARGNLTTTGSPVAKLSHGVRYVKFDAALSQRADLTTGASFGTALAQPYTIAVLTRVNGTGIQRVFNSGTSITNQGPEISSQDTPRNWYANTQDMGTLTDDGTWQYIVYMVNGTSSIMRRNGLAANVTTGIGSGITLSGIRLGASSGTITYSTVDIAEVIVFKHIPGGPELASLESYLSARADLLNGL